MHDKETISRVDGSIHSCFMPRLYCEIPAGGHWFSRKPFHAQCVLSASIYVTRTSFREHYPATTYYRLPAAITLEMPLLDIANELLLCISENLESESDINAFTRTNRQLYFVLNDYLYRHNVQKFGGGSALLWAAKHGQEVAAQRLLGEGA